MNFVLVMFWIFVIASACHFILAIMMPHPRKQEWTLAMDVSAGVGRMLVAFWAAWLLWG